MVVLFALLLWQYDRIYCLMAAHMLKSNALSRLPTLLLFTVNFQQWLKPLH